MNMAVDQRVNIILRLYLRDISKIKDQLIRRV